MTRTEPIDESAVLVIVGNDIAFLKQLTELYRCEHPAMMAQIREAIRTDQPAALQTAAHAMKSMVGNFYAHTAYAQCGELEALGHSGRTQGAEPVLAELELEVVRVEHALNKLAGLAEET